MIEVKCDICGRKIEGAMYNTVVVSGVNLSDGYHEDTTHRCIPCGVRVDNFIKSITNSSGA